MVRKAALLPERHVSVLLAETVDLLRPRDGGRYVDGTLGGGGHAEAILERSGPSGRLLGLDLDPEAIERVGRRLQRFGSRAVLVHESFTQLERAVRWEGFAPADGVLLDLGLSSYQLDTGERGFSIRAEAPLDMRFNPRANTPTARDLVARLGVDELTGVLRRFGEEPGAKTIARAIVERRERRPIETTADLAAVVERAVGRRGRIHPATRTFQALRIAVNRELEALEAVLPQAIEVLGFGGRLAVISFHSLEDRIVKRFFVDQAATCVCPPGLPVCVCGRTPTIRIITRHGIKPSDRELAANPRSRSSTLRVAEKITGADDVTREATE
jgi:16S rRNA (cytosine1402-N4)-methyltransferase